MPPDIEYHLRNQHGDDQRIDLYLDASDHSLVVPDNYQAPEWARLDHCQCSHCPLSHHQHRDCPVARNLAYTLPKTDLGPSHEPVTLEVHAHQRCYRMETTLQRALGSLFGLVCALSDCPHTLFLRPMAQFHLPVSNERETLVRSASLYLLQRYVAQQQDPSISVDLEGLNHQYQQINTLNHCFVERLRRGRDCEAPVNALVLLQVLTKDMKSELEEVLASLAPLFSLQEDEDASRPAANDY
ncbi:MAG: hypothetical protein R3292_09640 [Alcanivorax sp.]|nr:hypothetical protein [Alcanivorax sp.]